MDRLNKKRLNEAIKYLTYSGEVVDYLCRRSSRQSPLRKQLQEGVTKLGETIDFLQSIENSIKNENVEEDIQDDSEEKISEEN